jgi:hypothetical protein
VPLEWLIASNCAVVTRLALTRVFDIEVIVFEIDDFTYAVLFVTIV